MYQKHIREKEARKKLLKGINTVADIVADTIGPFGNNVCINNVITNDGVTIAKCITLEDPFEDAGAYLIKDAADKTNKKVGDGTTTTTILARELSNRFSELSRKISGNVIRDQAKDYLNDITKSLKNSALPCDTIENLTNIASNSVEDTVIGKMIAETVLEVGQDGIIRSVESKTGETYNEIFKGLKIERGFVSPFMCTDMNKMIAEYKNMSVLVTDQDINDMDDIYPLLRSLVVPGEEKKRLLIVCDNMSNEVIADVVNTLQRGSIEILVVRGAIGTQKKGGNEDIAIMTGAKFFSEDRNDDLSLATIDDLGFAEKVIANKNETILLNGGGTKEVVETRVNAIKSEIELSTSDYEKDKLKERIAKLGSGIGMIYVGGDSDIERSYIKDKIEDAIHATQSAFKNGMVIGGGYSLYLAAHYVLKDYKDEIAKAIIDSCSKPLQKIFENSNLYNEKTIHSIIEEAREGSYCSVMTGEYIDPLEEGLVDPVEVEIEAIKNAISVASILITTNTLIVDVLAA